MLASASLAQAHEEGLEPVRDLQVEMRDGSVLRADLWAPVDSEGPWPVLLIRTPYGRGLEETSGRQWSGKGYAVVIQAVRGRDGSDGVWIPWERDLEDGRDTIEWLENQEWCNGRIGMMGGSYLGHVQILAAASGHPALDCIVPVVSGSDGFSDVPFSGGILKLSMIYWLYMCRGPTVDLSGRWPDSADASKFAHLPLARVYEDWAGLPSEIWQRWTGVETLADMPGLTIWDRLATVEHKVPALHVGGYWDGESTATRRNWERFSALGGGDQYLLFGPWPHSNWSSSYADVDYGDAALVDFDVIKERWYEHWLEGDGRPALELPRVQVFATGANAWLRSDTWPAPEATARSWYVDRSNADQSRLFAYGLSERKPTEGISWSWVYDPSEIPSPDRDLDFMRSTRLWFGAEDAGALVLATAPFDKDRLLTGPAELELALESSAEDTDLHVLIVEVTVSGEVRALQRPTPLRLRFREGYDRAIPLVPGEVHRVLLQLGILAHRFEAGSRMGIAIRSEWFPSAARNLGTLEPIATATRTVLQRNSIHSGPLQLSSLRLWELPLASLSTSSPSAQPIGPHDSPEH